MGSPFRPVGSGNVAYLPVSQKKLQVFCGSREKSAITQAEPEYTDRMIDETQQQSIVTRLNRVEGQIRGIRRMVQEPRLCVELLQQLSAAEAALNRISLAVFKFHVERCVPDGIVQGDPEKTRRLAELVDIFDRFAK
jgi:CsoR family transcriptional regulator, copper-sensing transcriptional repressor